MRTQRRPITWDVVYSWRDATGALQETRQRYEAQSRTSAHRLAKALVADVAGARLVRMDQVTP